MNRGASQRLEKIHRELHPHPLGMASLYMTWSYLIGIAALFMGYRDQLIPWVMGRVSWFVRNDDAYTVLWAISLVIPGVILSVVRIRWRWIFVLAGAGALGYYLRTYTVLGNRHSTYWVDNVENVTLIAIGVLGICGTELHRLSHKYLVTDRRVIFRYRGLTSHERSVFYSRIDDLVLETSFLGKLFGFGSVVPLSGSGLGLGSVAASVSGMVGGRVLGTQVGMAVGGSHSENVVKAAPANCLYNVPDPEGLYELIASQMSLAQAA